ncbi:MAG: DUF302 domain-containing protein [Myxococcales bacterium]|jgi:uncharacterized protein (DUF302 family)
MSYCFIREVDRSFEEAIEAVTEQLKERGFGVLTRIDVKDTLKKKIDVDFRPYVILGACNPEFAHRALSMEPNIGVMLPCNVIVQQAQGGKVQVAAVDPVASMQAVDNPELGELAGEVRNLLKQAVEAV